MSEETLKEKTAKGLFWGGISNGAQQILGLAFGIFLGRILSAEDYGLIAMLAIFTGIANAIINSGFSVALTNKQHATQEDYNAVFWFSLFVGLALYIVLFFSAPLIARFYNRPELTALSRVIFISFFFSGVAVVPYTILFKRLMVKQQALIDITALFLSGLLGVTLAIQGFAYWAIALQNVVYITLSSSLRCVVSPWRPSFHIDFSPLKEFFSFSLKLFLTNIFQQIQYNFFSVLLAKLYNATQAGYYSQGFQWAGKGNQLISGMITQVAQPVIVQVNDDPERQLNVFRKIIRFISFIAFPAFLGLAFVAKEFIVIAIGDKWLPSVPFLQLFCVWAIACCMSVAYTYLLLAHGKSDVYMKITIAVSLLQLLIVGCMYPFGLFPMVVAYLITYIIGMLSWQYYAKKLIAFKFRDFIKDISPYFIISSGCIGIAWFATLRIENIYMLILLKVMITALLYAAMMKLSNAVIFQELVSFLKRR
ncbi:MAG: lipopolysaccharide biosynthesis protein [Tannerellaceae bacterium]|jgi:O-antigen/teichoic acid export membrane protein|nr:lipopolysaccharide biosynthesis protein [Tannerellaceae bacterium]